MQNTPYQTKELKFDNKSANLQSDDFYEKMEERLSKAEQIMDEARKRRSLDREFSQQLKDINDLFKN